MPYSYYEDEMDTLYDQSTKVLLSDFIDNNTAELITALENSIPSFTFTSSNLRPTSEFWVLLLALLKREYGFVYINTQEQYWFINDLTIYTFELIQAIAFMGVLNPTDILRNPYGETFFTAQSDRNNRNTNTDNTGNTNVLTNDRITATTANTGSNTTTSRGNTDNQTQSIGNTNTNGTSTTTSQGTQNTIQDVQNTGSGTNTTTYGNINEQSANINYLMPEQALPGTTGNFGVGSNGVPNLGGAFANTANTTFLHRQQQVVPIVNNNRANSSMNQGVNTWDNSNTVFNTNEHSVVNSQSITNSNNQVTTTLNTTSTTTTNIAGDRNTIENTNIDTDNLGLDSRLQMHRKDGFTTTAIFANQFAMLMATIREYIPFEDWIQKFSWLIGII